MAIEIREAAKQRDIATLKKLLAEDPKLVHSPEYPVGSRTVLHYAAEGGSVEAVKILLAAGADPDAADGLGQTPLHWTAAGGHLEASKALLDTGADPRAADDNGRTPMHMAAFGGNKAIVELLLAHGVNHDRADDDGRTPLHLAATGGHKAVVELLLARDADVRAKDLAGHTLLHRAAASGNAELVELLISKGMDVNAGDNGAFTPLHHARGADKAVAELLISKGARIGARSKNGLTPLHTAAGAGSKPLVELLISKGVEVDVRDDGGPTPLMSAFPFGIPRYSPQLDLRIYYVGQPADALGPNWGAVDRDECDRRAADVAAFLIDKGADVNARFASGETALHGAIWNLRFRGLEVLIVRGADVEIPDSEGRMPLELARLVMADPSDREPLIRVLDSGIRRRRLARAETWFQLAATCALTCAGLMALGFGVIGAKMVRQRQRSRET
jgi:cytohesin